MPHIRQLFWNQDLIYAVEATEPYSSNTVEITTKFNKVDRVFLDKTAGTMSDLVPYYVYLGDSLDDDCLVGLLLLLISRVNTRPSITLPGLRVGTDSISSILATP